MLWRVTYLSSSDYCDICPSDPECHGEVFVNAESKEQAAWKFTNENTSGYDVNHNRLPMIWTITKAGDKM